MNCPSCKSLGMTLKETTTGLHLMECPSCSGHWLKSFEYWRWLNNHPARLAEQEQTKIVELPDNKTIKSCPECSRNLMAYKVGHGTHFTIERCNHCAGVWFDANEFEILEAKNLHDEIHYMFSATWQEEVEHEEDDEVHKDRIRKILGDEEFEVVDTFKEFFQKQRFKQAEIIAYLKY